jgi:hypothetical protein
MTSPSHSRSRQTAYWACQLGGWGLFFLLNVVVSQGYAALTWTGVFGYATLSAAGVLLTHGYRAYIRRHGWTALPVRRLLRRAIAANLFLAVLLVAIVSAYFALAPASGVTLSPRGRTGAAAMLLLFVFNDFIMLSVWSGIYFGVAYFRREQRAEIERFEAKTALAEAELRGLKSQLNPHFLFNSLNSLRALVTEDPARAQEAITHLAEILRYHLQSGEHSLVPLADELATAEQYLALELIRFEDRLTVERTFDEHGSGYLVPPLAVQTLVENAVKYGVSREDSNATIRLTTIVRDKQLLICVRNTGRLQNGAQTSSTSLGLANLRTRLRLLFGERASLELHESEPGWVEARIVLPVTRNLERMAG